MEDPDRVVVPMGFVLDDWHLMQECVRAVARNLRHDMDNEDKAHVQRRCAEVILKIDDFVVEANYLVKESRNEHRAQGVDRDSPGFDFYSAVFRGERKA